MASTDTAAQRSASIPLGLERVVIGADGSEHSYYAVRLGGWLASLTAAEVILVHAMTRPEEVLPGLIAGDEMRATQAKAVEKLIAHAGGILDDVDVRWRAETTDSVRPEDAILDTAEKFGADLIVVGQRGLGTVGRMLLGSVSRAVVYNAPCAVLVAPPPADPG